MSGERLDVTKSPFDCGSFLGRLKYFAWITDPRLGLTSTRHLLEARELLNAYKQHAEPPGTTPQQVRRAQQLYLSAFHPDSGELQNVIGRMSFQVPGGMILIGAMITFYKSNVAVVFWQWANQSFNALVNYTNRNAASDVSTKRLATAYVSATSCALIVALGLKKFLATRASPLVQRFVPFAAVAAANAVNIPLMRQSELLEGVLLYDANNQQVTQSRYAALKGISQVVFARIIMAAPSMTLLPALMERLEVTRILLFMVPAGCAIFPQRCSITTDKLKYLDSKQLEELRKSRPNTMPDRLYFNKGL
ncbi:hypothetical protein BaRGS_00030887 [Batillaria attramentaria]|uniref:Sidoreflexin n=1 Tax=Batillaria attramentaria TaxID=370345 RepID=A0ABD0JS04_9CAEN